MLKNILTPLLSGLCGFLVLFVSTDGFKAFTAEQGRRFDAINNPEKIAPVTLTTHLGDEITYFQDDEEIIVVEFIFTYCPAICQSLGQSFYQMQEAIKETELGDKVKFVSISFDLEVDDVDRLATFAENHGADDLLWRVAKPQNKADLDRLLKQFGIVVIDDPIYRFIHNGGLHVVDPSGKLIAIFDPEDVEGSLELIREMT